MSIRDKIKEYIRELVRRELEEASVTGNLDGGAGPPKTPYMFQSKPKSKKDKEKEKKIAQAGGYMKVDEASVNEGQYHNYRNDDSMTPRQKIGLSMREVRDKLNELDKLVKINVRLKNELNVDSKTYWKRTHTAMKKISERLVKLANKVGQLY